MKKPIDKYPALPFVAPFATFLGLLAVRPLFPDEFLWAYPIHICVVTLVLALTSRQIISFRPSRIAASLFVGLIVFAIWVGPDFISSNWREHWLFTNSITGAAESSIAPKLRTNMIFLVFRLVGSAVLVPIIEELFWRGWLMRYLIAPNFQKVPVGTFSAVSFWVTALLFAMEHGPYWEVGFLAGLAYNGWAVRTRNLADCMVAHGMTNLCLGIFVVKLGEWQYWL